jgi:hypothetical protein
LIMELTLNCQFELVAKHIAISVPPLAFNRPRREHEETYYVCLKYVTT